jgi:uncharacterized protein
MERYAYRKLLEWKKSARRKPLLIQGARQVGKTYLIKDFGKNEYQQVLYLNFEEDKSLSSFFKESLEPKAVINSLEIYKNIKVDPDSTLIVMDEIQASSEALNSLKYFNEVCPEYHVIAAGSLLGIILLSDAAFPVGQVNLLELYPFTFFEFLHALGHDKYVSLIDSLNSNSKIPEPIHEKLIQLLKLYYIIGGMPEVIDTYLFKEHLDDVREVQSEILKTYTYDFAKHAKAVDIPRLHLVWESIPKYLGRENKQFVFSKLKDGARGRDYEYSLKWLEAAGLIYFCYNVNTPQFPLKHYKEKSFKVYYHDTGLLGAASNLPPNIIIEKNRLFTEFNGALVENFAAQELRSTITNDLYYWTNYQGKAEIDFLLEHYPEIYPLEIKAGINLRSKSLKSYTIKYNPSLSLRSSLQNLKKESSVINIPLYALSTLRNIIKI